MQFAIIEDYTGYANAFAKWQLLTNHERLFVTIVKFQMLGIFNDNGTPPLHA